jgi:hypothetical protein
MEPQLAMKVLANFDRSVAEVLAEKVRSRMTFKVCLILAMTGGLRVWQINHTGRDGLRVWQIIMLIRDVCR